MVLVGGGGSPASAAPGAPEPSASSTKVASAKAGPARTRSSKADPSNSKAGPSERSPGSTAAAVPAGSAKPAPTAPSSASGEAAPTERKVARKLPTARPQGGATVEATPSPNQTNTVAFNPVITGIDENDASVTIHWDQPNAAQGVISHYQVIIDNALPTTGGCAGNLPGTARSCTHPAPNGVQLKIQVWSSYQTGNYPAYTTYTTVWYATPQARPEPPTVNPPTLQGTTATVTWTPATTGSAATAFDVRVVRQGSGTAPTCTQPDPQTSPPSCTFTGERGATYDVDVRGRIGAGTGEYSTPAQQVIVPQQVAVPTFTGALPFGQKIYVGWTMSEVANVSGYRVEATSSTGAPGVCTTPIQGGGGNSNTAFYCEVTGLTDGATYTLKITAEAASGYAPAEIEVPQNVGSFTMVPLVPSPLPTPVATAAPGNGAINVDWTMADDLRLGGFTVTATAPGETSPAGSCPQLPKTERTCRISGLSEGTTYDVAVVARSIFPILNADDTTAELKQATPVAFAIDSAEAIAGAQAARIGWTFPAGEESAISGFTVTADDGNGGTASCTAPAANERSCRIAGLNDGATYTVTITAVAANGIAADNAVTTRTVVPSARVVSDVEAVPADGAALVSWTFSGDPAVIKEFDVIASTTDMVEHPCSGPVEATATSCRITGLDNGTSYKVRVTAVPKTGDQQDAAEDMSLVTPGTLLLTDLLVRPAEGVLRAEWTFPPEQETAITGWEVTVTDPGGTVTTCPEKLAPGARGCRFAGLADGTAYVVTVTAVSATGDKADNVSTTVSEIPRKARIQTGGVVPGNGSIYLYWALPQEDEYLLAGSTVTAQDGNGGVFTCVPLVAGGISPELPPSARSCRIAGLTNGTTYTVTFVQHYATADPADDRSESAMVAPQPLPAVTPTVVRGSQALNVSWEFPQGDEWRITGFTATTGSGASCKAAAAERGCRIEGLTDQNPYEVTVTAWHLSGDPADDDQQVVTGTPSTLPAPVVTATPGNGALLVSWTFPQGSEGLIDGFVVGAGTGKDAVVCDPAVAPSGRSCRIPLLDNGTAYTVQVVAVPHGSTDQRDAATGRVDATPGMVPPTGTVVTPGNGALNVAWTYPADRQAEVSGFRVEARDGGGATFTCAATLDPTARSCRVAGLANDEPYTVTVTAVAASGVTDDDATESVADQIPVELPLGLIDVDGTNGGLVVEWSYPSEKQAWISGFTVTAGTASCTPVPGPGVRTCAITGLTNGTQYTVTVTAVSVSGDPDDDAGQSAVGRPTLGAPGIPTGVKAVPGDASAQVSWTPPTNAGQGITGYVVAISAGESGDAKEVGPNETSTTVTGLTNGQTYLISVFTSGVDGESLLSEGMLVTPAAPIPVPATVPSTVDGRLDSSEGQALPKAGAETVLLGEGFAPNTPVQLLIYSQPWDLGTAVTDENGEFAQAVRIPAGFTGAHTFVSIGLDPDGNARTMTLPVTVGAATTTTVTTGTGLAVTGLPITMIMITGLGLILTGAASRVLGQPLPAGTVRRRRRR
jgi:hypothetical protein